MKRFHVIAMLFLCLTLGGCEKATDKPASKEGSPPPGQSPPAARAEAGGHGGPVIELGTINAVAFSVRASRDKGEVKPGGEVPIDVWIDGGVGKDVSVVRFWIGTHDAKGSIKAKADIEDGKWHTHVEVPDPMPAASMVWVEIQTSEGKRAIGSFELKMQAD